MTRLALAILFLLMTAFPALAGFDEGHKAYNEKNWQDAIINLRPLADNGDDRAMILLGNMYLFGYGLTPDAQVAEKLYAQAAQLGNTDAMLALGALNINGDFGNISYNNAADWFRQSAEHGNQMGAFYYATTILRGNKSDTDDLKSDPYTAYKWFKIAANQKQNPDIANNAAHMAAMIAEKLISQDDITRADQEIANWSPKNSD